MDKGSRHETSMFKLFEGVKTFVLPFTQTQVIQRKWLSERIKSGLKLFSSGFWPFLGEDKEKFGFAKRGPCWVKNG